MMKMIMMKMMENIWPNIIDIAGHEIIILKYASNNYGYTFLFAENDDK